MFSFMENDHVSRVKHIEKLYSDTLFEYWTAYDCNQPTVVKEGHPNCYLLVSRFVLGNECFQKVKLLVEESTLDNKNIEPLLYCYQNFEMNAVFAYSLNERLTLREYLNELTKTCSSHESALILIQLLTAIDAVHTNNMSHLHLNLSCILLKEGRYISIAGAGLVSSLQACGVERDLVNDETLSPEEISTSKLLPSSDIYNVAKIYFRCLTVEPLFRNKFIQIAIKEGQINNLPSFVPPYCNALVNKMMRPDEKQRDRARMLLSCQEMRILGEETKLTDLIKLPTKEHKLGQWDNIFYSKNPDDSEDIRRIKSYNGVSLTLDAEEKELKTQCTFCFQNFQREDTKLEDIKGKMMTIYQAHKELLCLRIWSEILKLLFKNYVFCKQCFLEKNTSEEVSKPIDFSTSNVVCSICEETFCIYCLNTMQWQSHDDNINDESTCCDVPYSYFNRVRIRESKQTPLTANERKECFFYLIKSGLRINMDLMTETRGSDLVKLFGFFADLKGEYSVEKIKNFELNEDFAKDFPRSFNFRG